MSFNMPVIESCLHEMFTLPPKVDLPIHPHSSLALQCSSLLLCYLQLLKQYLFSCLKVAPQTAVILDNERVLKIHGRYVI
jgi:hypothetical protein